MKIGHDYSHKHVGLCEEKTLLDQYLDLAIPKIEKQLDLLVPETKSQHNKLFQAARHSLLNGGKRLRPILTLVTTYELKGNTEAALIPACALELIHTYSLIHDDLPCMDNDDFRRGKPTLHKLYNEADALLTGDYLLTRAFEILANAPLLSNEQKIALISTLAQRAGGNGMIGGQIMDVQHTGKEISPEILKEIHCLKTGALLTASLEFAAIISNASKLTMEILNQFGTQIGLAFQIVDDLIDYTANKRSPVYKGISSDKANNKVTYLSLYGYDDAKKKAQELLQSSLNTLMKIPEDTSLLASLAKLLINRQS